MSNPLNIDMTRGSIPGKIVLFVLPLIVISLLQMIFNTADMVVIARWFGISSLAAIGSAGAITALPSIVIGGIAVGALVTAAQRRGAGDAAGLNRAAGVSLGLALATGVIFMAAGVILARPLMVWMSCPSDIIDKAVRYLRIHSIGIPFAAVGTVGLALMFAAGDSLLPLLVTVVVGVVKVGLNMLFVIVFKWDVAGVATATVLSQILTVLAVLAILIFLDGSVRIFRGSITDVFIELGPILLVGAPVMLSGLCLHFSGVMIQGGINSLGSHAVAGNVAACWIEGVMYVIVSAMCRTATVFAAQNCGAKKYDRVLKGVLTGAGLLSVAVTALSVLGLVFGRQLAELIIGNPEVVESAMRRLWLTLPAYVLPGLAEVAAGGLRGIWWSAVAAVSAVLGSALRIVWFFVVFPKYHTLTSLCISYPVSWGLVVLLNGGLFFYLVSRLIKKQRAAETLGEG